MRFFYFTLVLLGFALQSYADTESRAVPYQINSENEKYSLHAIPFEYYGAVGESYVIDNKNEDTLYRIDEYLKYDILLDNTGQYIIAINTFAYYQAFQDIIAFSIYFKGICIERVRLNEIIGDTTNLFYSTQHVLWLSDYAINNTEFIIKTFENKAFIFGFKERLKEANLNEVSISDYFKLRTTYYDTIDYPNHFEFPFLINGKALFDSFNFSHSYKVFDNRENSEKKVQPFYLVLIVYQNGTAEFLKISENAKDEKYLYGIDKCRQNEIIEFISNVEFNSVSIPNGLKKWTFHDWVYVEE